MVSTKFQLKLFNVILVAGKTGNRQSQQQKMLSATKKNKIVKNRAFLHKNEKKVKQRGFWNSLQKEKILVSQFC